MSNYLSKKEQLLNGSYLEETRENVEPAYFRFGPVNIDGAPANRLMIVLKTKGCEYARKTAGGCTVCGFLNHALQNITGDETSINWIIP